MVAWFWKVGVGQDRADAAEPGAGLEALPNQACITTAERFTAPAGFQQVHLPFDTIPSHWDGMLDVVICEEATQAVRRLAFPVSKGSARPVGEDLMFPAFVNAAAGLFTIVAATGADAVPVAVMLAQARTLTGGRAPIVLRCAGRGLAPPLPRASPALAYAFEVFWCDRSGLFVKGWIHAFDRTISRLRINAGGQTCVVDNFTARADVAQHFMAYEPSLHSGFSAYVSWRPGQPVMLEAETDHGTITEPAVFPAAPDPVQLPPTANGANEAFQSFIAEINDRELATLEVGARKVSANWADWRTACNGASRYLGMDIHPGVGVDIVGDAHYLPELVGLASLDAVFSLSVLEHLSHPWRFAQSVAAVLRVGGLTFHGTHQTWPMHEEPNDFWRFSDEGLKTLFGLENGFEVIAAGMGDQVAIYPGSIRQDHLMMPLVSAFGQSFILARKVREIEFAPTRFADDEGQSGARAKLYPRRDG